MFIDKEIVKAIGIRNSIIFYIFLFVETLINLPFYISKISLFPFYWIYNKFLDKEAIFYLRKIKRLNEYAIKIIKMYKEYDNSKIGKIPDENLNIGKKETKIIL